MRYITNARRCMQNKPCQTINQLYEYASTINYPIINQLELVTIEVKSVDE